MAMEPKNGSMVLFMKAIGGIVALMARVNSSILTVGPMKDAGLTTKHVGMAFSYLQIRHPTKANGRMTLKMVKELKNGKTVQNTKALTAKLKSTAMGSIHGQTEANLKDNWSKTNFQDLEYTHG